MNMRVVVTLTTLPNRYPKLIRTIKSILDQTYKPDVIYLGIPKVAKRLNIPYPDLPQEIYDTCTVVQLDEDYGPICKILGGWISEPEPDTCIITIDDDTVYPSNLIEEFVKKSNIYQNSVIGSTGLLLGNTILDYSSVSAITPGWNGFTGFSVPREGRAVDILCGVSGILYRRKFFPDDLGPMLKYAQDNPDLFINDDVLLSLYIGSRGIERRVFVNLPNINMSETFDPNIDIQDGNEISFSRVKFLQRFHRAINSARQLGLLKEPVPNTIDDSFPIRIMFLFFLTIFLILAIWLIYRYPMIPVTY